MQYWSGYVGPTLAAKHLSHGAEQPYSEPSTHLNGADAVVVAVDKADIVEVALKVVMALVMLLVTLTVLVTVLVTALLTLLIEVVEVLLFADSMKGL